MYEVNDGPNHGSGEVVTFSFVSPTKTEKISYSGCKNKLVRALQEHDWFERGVLFSTLEKGVIFPVIHMIEDDVSHDKRNQNDDFKSDSIGEGFVLHQGKYKEIRRMPQRSNRIEKEAPYSSLDRQFRDGPINNAKNCFFIGFKSLDTHFNEVLEDSWGDWTGARFVYLNMNDDFGLKTLRFFRRISPADINLFMYIVFAECCNIKSDNKISLLDFVQRFRVDKMAGYVSVYENRKSIDSLSEGVNGIVVSGRRESKDRRYSDYRNSYAQRSSNDHGKARYSPNRRRGDSVERDNGRKEQTPEVYSPDPRRRNSRGRGNDRKDQSPENGRRSFDTKQQSPERTTTRRDSSPGARRNSRQSLEHRNSRREASPDSGRNSHQSPERRNSRKETPPGSRQDSDHESEERSGHYDHSPDRRDDPSRYSNYEKGTNDDRYQSSGDDSPDRSDDARSRRNGGKGLDRRSRVAILSKSKQPEKRQPPGKRRGVKSFKVLS